MKIVVTFFVYLYLNQKEKRRKKTKTANAITKKKYSQEYILKSCRVRSQDRYTLSAKKLKLCVSCN